MMTKPPHTGMELLQDPRWNKGTAFSEAERDLLGIRGLLPPHVFTMEEQTLRILENVRRKENDLDRYIFLIGLQDRNERLFYHTVLQNIEEMMPIIYTPTVGEACAQFTRIYRRPRGMYISPRDRGRIAEVLRNWPESEVGVVVVTDGERILGLGDLGANGMGIPIGKLSLYTACGGIPPAWCLPVTLDVGTENEALREDPIYIGLRERRLRGAAYDELVDEFILAVREVFPRAIIQFEDFANHNAFRFLEKYRHQVRMFNDDIQGTAAVALAGLFSALRISGGTLTEQTIVFLGAGEAATGIANLICAAMKKEGLSTAEARRRCWLVDSKGLVVQCRDDLQPHKKPYAHDHPFAHGLEDIIEDLKPTVLIGVSGQPQTFRAPVVRAMAQINAHPIIFALSNPTSKAECTAEQALEWSEGQAIFASGSPFKPVTLNGRTYVIGQANNAYIFPGLGLGVLASQATHIVDEMFHAAARALADQVSKADLDTGSLFPPLSDIRAASRAIAVRVAEVAYEEGLAEFPRPENLAEHLEHILYEAVYPDYV
jgi:malate dehydrogenase (oxaloacetate-decarboxylating)(NADP+)